MATISINPKLAQEMLLHAHRFAEEFDIELPEVAAALILAGSTLLSTVATEVQHQQLLDAISELTAPRRKRHAS